MSCCNSNCDQGRNCPNRKYTNLWIIAPIATGILMFVLLFVEIYKQEHRTIRYNCSLAEISPDFPLTVKEECRKLKKI